MSLSGRGKSLAFGFFVHNQTDLAHLSRLERVWEVVAGHLVPTGRLHTPTASNGLQVPPHWVLEEVLLLQARRLVHICDN